MKKNLLIILLAISSICMAQKGGKKKPAGPPPTYQKSIFFESGKYELTDSGKMSVMGIIDSLTQYSVFQIFIKGNADATGDSIKNQKLSEDRSLKVKELMVTSGVDEKFITVNSLGENAPVASNETEDGKRMNRRVDIIINYTRKPPDSLFSIWQKCGGQLHNSLSKHCITPFRDTVIVGPQGTLFMIPGSAFVGVNAKTKGCIEIVVKEDFLFSEMLADRLTSTANGKPLSTSGIVYIMASLNGANLQLKPKMKIGILMPKTERMPSGTLLYEGEREKGEKNSNPEDNAINWKDFQKNMGVLDSYSRKDLGDWVGCGPQPHERCPLFFCKIARFFGLKKKKGDPLKPPTGCPMDEADYARLQQGIVGSLGYNFKNPKDKLGLMLIAENWRAQLKDNATQLSNRDLSNWAFAATNKLGWINFDRLYASKEERTFVSVDIAPQKNIDFYLVFNREKMLLPQITEGKDFTKDNIIPKGMQAKLVVLKYEKGQPYYFIKDITIGDPQIHVEFKAASPAEIKEAFKVLDN